MGGSGDRSRSSRHQFDRKKEGRGGEGREKLAKSGEKVKTMFLKYITTGKKSE